MDGRLTTERLSSLSQNGEFKEVLSCYSSIRREDPIEYIDLDNDGTYEIKIPDLISIDRIPTAARPEWMSLYKWDGNTYVLNNEKILCRE